MKAFTFKLEQAPDPKLLAREMRNRKAAADRYWRHGAFWVALLQALLLFAGIGVILVFIFEMLNLSRNMFGLAFPVLSGLLGFGFVRLQFRSNLRWQADQLSRSPVFRNGCSFNLNERGIEIRGKGASWAADWEVVEQLRITDEAVTAYAGNYAHVLPMAAVPVEDRQALLKQVRIWCSA